MEERIRLTLNNIYNLIEEDFKSRRNDHSGLLTGLSGSCLFLFYYGRVMCDESATCLAEEVLDRVMENMQFVPVTTNYTYCNGLSGSGWLLSHLKENGFIDFDDADIFEELDKQLHPIMMLELKKGNYDFLHGALGIYLYYVQRTKNSNSNFEIINSASAIIDQIKVQHESGVYWDSYSSLDLKKNVGTANLGLSHGVPSILSALARMNLYSQDNKYIPLIEDSANFLIKTKNIKGLKSLFPYSFDTMNSAPGYSRLGWCYGDLGVALSLMTAGVSLDNKEYIHHAIQIALHSTGRITLDDTNIVDAGLCHGTAGVAQIFRYFYLRSGDEKFLQAANLWTERSLDLLDQKTIIKTGKAKWDSENGFVDCRTILEGVGGIGLALLSSMSVEPLGWDECLLIS